jgi:surfactin synthase thioesterase subunit
MRLTCFPYAGGNAKIFRTLQSLLRDMDVMAIELPGRGSRMFEPACDSMSSLTEMLLEEFGARFDPPFALLGHSMGAAIAFELTCRLRDCGRSAPDHLFLSARTAPGEPRWRAPLHGLDDVAFKDALQRLGGTPSEIIENKELMGLILPTLRADFTLIERYNPQPGAMITTSITAFAGQDDKDVPASSMMAWQQLTSGSFQCHTLQGGHFFFEAASPDIARVIEQTLRWRCATRVNQQSATDAAALKSRQTGKA